MKMPESSPNKYQILWEKEELLIMSNSSFSHSVFKGLVLQTNKTQRLFGKELRDFTSGLVIWLATRQMGHSDICVNCVADRPAHYDHIRSCSKVDLLKKEKKSHEYGKCHSRLACSKCLG